jgi:hypothetical protein
MYNLILYKHIQASTGIEGVVSDNVKEREEGEREGEDPNTKGFIHRSTD